MRYDIVPVPKPRMTQSDRWKQRPAVMRYREFKDKVRESGIMVHECDSTLVFWLPMPKSWSNKKRAEMLGKPHKQKPDIDNLVKAVLDSIFEDDSHIWRITASKVWSDTGYIEIKQGES